MTLSYRVFRLAQRRTVWCPTLPGWLCIVLLLATPTVWWWCCGESFLSQTERLPAEVLVVEGWIGRDGVRAAAKEFDGHGYQYIVTTGGLTADTTGWAEPGWSYAEGAANELIRSGIRPDRIIVATANDTVSQRTYESAAAVRRALQAQRGRPRAVNVFTLGPHARRSRLVFGRVLQPEIEVGVIGWTAPQTEATPWWQASDRARELLTETAGFLYEALLSSGRHASFPGKILDRNSTWQPPGETNGI